MINPAALIRDAVAALNRWFERAEREEEESLRELVAPPVHESVKDDHLKRTSAGPVLDLRNAEPPREHQAANIPPPPMNPPPPRVAASATPSPVRTGVAGLANRRAPGNRNEQLIVQNDANDTAYRQRNEVVAEVARRYEKYGKRVATAILGKVFLPNGLEALLAKLGLISQGSADADHAQVVGWIDANGVETFCARLGIRTAIDSPAAPGPKAKGARPTFKKESAKPTDSTAPGFKLRQTNIKPVSLGKPPAPEQDRVQEDEFSAGRFPPAS